MDSFEYKFTNNDTVFRYAKGKSITSGDEIHPFFEILYYLGGNATLLTERFESELIDKSLIIIPKECYHNFKIKEQNNYKRLFIRFPSEPYAEPDFNNLFSDIKIISPNRPIFNLLSRITEVLSDDAYTEHRKNILNSILPLLLTEICVSHETLQPTLRQDEHLITKCVNFIDDRIDTKISVTHIAREMGVSVSSLHLCFKEHLGISVYKYITEKRLINAHKLISTGKNPTKIFSDCGFNDYPTFFKAYKKKFGISPGKNLSKYKFHE